MENEKKSFSKKLIMDLVVGVLFIVAYLVLAILFGGTTELWISLLGGLVVILGSVYLVMQFRKLTKLAQGDLN